MIDAIKEFLMELSQQEGDDAIEMEEGDEADEVDEIERVGREAKSSDMIRRRNIDRGIGATRDVKFVIDHPMFQEGQAELNKEILALLLSEEACDTQFGIKECVTTSEGVDCKELGTLSKEEMQKF